ALVAQTATVTKVERLVTADRKSYLGVQIDPKTFQTCEGNKLDIGQGKVERTNDPCPTRATPTVWPRPRPIVGIIKELNPESKTFSITNDAGETMHWFIPLTKQDEVPLKLYQ